MNKYLSPVFTLTLSLLVACGGDDDGGMSVAPDAGNDLAQGFTSCGNFPDFMPKTCNPGQYCADEGFSECALGCLGDYNCESGSTCRKEAGEAVGVCDGAAPEPDPDPEPTDELQRCIDSCSTLTSCGAIDVGEGAQCNSDCNGLSDGQRKAFADCVGDWDCSGGIPACLGLECGPAYDCPAGQDCLGGTCL